MSLEENKAIARRWFEELWNGRNPSIADEVLHPDYVYGNATPEGYSPGKQSVQAFKDGQADWLRIMPDNHFTIDEVTGEGDTVVVRWTAHGTHQGEWEMFMGKVPASGKATITSGTSSFHFKDGKIIRDVNHVDFLSTLQQIGAVVQPGNTE